MSTVINKTQFNFRRAKISDIKYVIEMIQELADWENMSKGPQLTEKDLIRDGGLNGDPEICHIYILELLQDKEENFIPIGYSICYISYSTWQGKCYFLEDLYVRKKYRGLGGGKHMIHEIAVEAKRRHCKRIEFNVLSWNPAVQFYKKLGAINITQQESWHAYRFNEKQIHELAANKIQNI